MTRFVPSLTEMDSSPRHKYDIVIFSGTCANCCWPGLPAKSGKWLHVVQVRPWWVIFREGGILKANFTRAILNFLYLVSIYPYIELARAPSVLQNSLLSGTAVSATQGNTAFTFKSTLCFPEEATGEQKLSLSNLWRGVRVVFEALLLHTARECRLTRGGGAVPCW